MENRTWTWLRIALLIGLTNLAGCSSSSTSGETKPTGSQAPTSGADATAAGPERIAYGRFDTSFTVPKLWTANSDGSDTEPVGDQEAWFPDWSPDRTLLIFGFTDDNGDDQIATIRPDGRDLTFLTEGAGYNEAPDYSPDGASVIYAHGALHEDEAGFTTRLWVMKANGSQQHPLPLGDAGLGDTEAEYSPDGKQIVFLRGRNAPNGEVTAIHVADADGSDLRRVTPWEHKVEHPRWSPDGRTIIYNVEDNTDVPSNEGEGIWTVPARGGRPALLLESTDQVHGYKPDYSPEGQRIIFGCARDYRTSEDICLLNADGTGVQPVVTAEEYAGNHVVWD